MFGKISYRLIIFFQIIIIIFLSFLIFYKPNPDPQAISNDPLVQKLSSCPFENQTKNILCIQYYLESFIINNGPQEALNYVRNNNIPVPYDLKDGVECHNFAHALGFVAGKNSDNSIPVSLEKCGEDCFSGCYHGFFEGIKFNDQLQSKNLKEVCFNNKSQPDKISGCLHALGHYYMELESNHLNEGFNSCLDLDATIDFQKDCLSGAWMQAETRGRSPQVPETTPHMPTPQTYVKFCNSFSQVVKEYCLEEGGPYVYRMTLDPKQSLDFCLKNSNRLYECLSSLGGFFHRKNLDNYDQYVIDNCDLGNNNYTLSCLKGVASSIVLTNDSLDKLISKCFDRITIDNSICENLSNLYLNSS